MTLLILPLLDIKNTCNMVTLLEARGERKTAVWRRTKSITKRLMRETTFILPRVTVSLRPLNQYNLLEVAII
jgi:hypothetical protein